MVVRRYPQAPSPMSLLRVRLRTLMIAVAVAALFMTFEVRVELERKRDRHLRLAAYHEREWARINEFRDRQGRHAFWLRFDERRRAYVVSSQARKDHEAALRAKYD